MRKLFCFFGWHSWIDLGWKNSEGWRKQCVCCSKINQCSPPNYGN